MEANVKQHDAGGYVKADIEPGYDRLAQKLTETLGKPPVKLSAREYQIVFAVISKTYRWPKKNDWLTNTQISSLTGIDRRTSGKHLRVIDKKCSS